MAKVSVKGELPRDLQAELSVIGSVLLDNRCLQDLRPMLRPEDFYAENHRVIFDAMLKLEGPVDSVTLSDYLRDRGEYKGSYAYLVQVSNETPLATNWRFYAKIIQRKAALRHLIGVAVDIADDCISPAHTDHDDDTSELAALDKHESKLSEALRSVRRDDGPFRGYQTGQEVFWKIVEQAKTRDAPMESLPTGFAALDAKCENPRGTLVIAAGWTGVGKTSMALREFIYHGKTGTRAHYIVLEDSTTKLSNRILAQMTGFSTRYIRQLLSGKIDTPQAAADLDLLSDHARALAELPISFEDTPGMTARVISMRIRDLSRQGVEFFIIDHALEIEGPSRVSSERERNSRNIACLRNVAAERNIYLKLLTQLRRPNIQQGMRAPNMTDLQETGKFEQAARAIYLLHRPYAHPLNSGRARHDLLWRQLIKNPHPAWCIVEKASEDSTGSIPLIFVPRPMIYREPTPTELIVMERAKREKKEFLEVMVREGMAHHPDYRVDHAVFGFN